jgi:hypothetical protein
MGGMAETITRDHRKLSQPGPRFLTNNLNNKMKPTSLAVTALAMAFSVITASGAVDNSSPDPNPANKDKITEWTKQYWTSLHSYSAGGAYVNFMMDEGDERIRATYRENYDRLSAIKAKYDPENFFRVNQNIKPKDKRTRTE